MENLLRNGNMELIGGRSLVRQQQEPFVRAEATDAQFIAALSRNVQQQKCCIKARWSSEYILDNKLQSLSHIHAKYF